MKEWDFIRFSWELVNSTWSKFQAAVRCSLTFITKLNTIPVIPATGVKMKKYHFALAISAILAQAKAEGITVPNLIQCPNLEDLLDGAHLSSWSCSILNDMLKNYVKLLQKFAQKYISVLAHPKCLSFWPVIDTKIAILGPHFLLKFTYLVEIHPKSPLKSPKKAIISLPKAT